MQNISPDGILRVENPGPVAGFRVGILIMESSYPLVPGNVQNAETFPFPVLYEVVEGIEFSQLAAGAEECNEPIIAAARRLEERGVSIIVGACGSFAQFQKVVAANVNVPAFISIMTQVPFLLAGIPKDKRLGIVFAIRAAWVPRVIEQCDITDTERLVIIAAEDIPEFMDLMSGSGEFNTKAVEEGMVRICIEAQQREKNIAAWLFQCSDLPPYAAAVQRATGLPVFDQAILIEHLYRSTARREY